MPTLEEANALIRQKRIEAAERKKALQGQAAVAGEIQQDWVETYNDTTSYMASETGKAVWGAVADSVTETGIFFGEAAADLVGLDDFLYTQAHSDGSFQGTAAAYLNPNLRSDSSEHLSDHYSDGLRAQVDKIAPDNESTAGNLARGLGQFLIPFMGWSRGLSATGPANQAAKSTQYGKILAAGAITDATAFDPDDANVTAFIRDYAELEDPVTEFLATDPTDHQATNRLRNALEGGLLGVTVDTALHLVKASVSAFKALRANRANKKVIEANEKAKEHRYEFEREPELDEVVAETPEVAPKETPKEAPENAATSPVQEPEFSLADTVREAVKLSPAQRKALNEALESGDYSTARGLINFNDKTIDWESMDDGDSIRRLLNTFSEVLESNIDDAKGGVQTLAQTRALAGLVGTTAEQAHKLFKDVRGHRGLTARMMAAEKTLLASTQRLRDLALKVKEEGANADKLALHRHIELHAGLMAEVKGSKTEVARALHAMRDMKAASALSFKEFDDIHKAVGGGKDDRAIADAILQSRDPDDIAQFVLKTTGRKVSDVITEIAVNGLLSSVKTHVINVASNLLNGFLHTGDRYLSVGVGKVLKRADRTTLANANAETYAKYANIAESFSLAARAAKQGKPVTDIRQRIEFTNRDSIKMDVPEEAGFNQVLARTVNVTGQAIRIPGRALMVGDEFFKSISNRGEIARLSHIEAHANADKLGLQGEKYAAYVQKERKRLVQEPTKEMKLKAIQYARESAFQEDAKTVLGQRMESLINANPIVKLIVAPFFKTPMNILRQGFIDRTPLSFMLKQTRETIRKGGPEADLAIARVFTGSSAMVIGTSLVSNGGEDKSYQIVGKRKYGNTETLDGIPDYSLRIGDTWYQYNRLDPVGSWLAFSADVVNSASDYDPSDPRSASEIANLASAGTAAFVNNVLNKTWTKSLQDILDTLTQIETGKPETIARATAKFSADNLFKVVPYSSAIRSIKTSGTPFSEGDPYVREAWTVADRILKNLPGYSSELPMKRDYLGREIEKKNTEWSWVNPFAANPDSKDPLDRELSRLGYDFQILPKALDSGSTPLNAEQYSEFLRLIGQEPLFGSRTLEDEMRRLVSQPSWERRPDEQKVLLLKKLYSGAKSAAEFKLKKKYPTLSEREDLVRKYKLNKLIGNP